MKELLVDSLLQEIKQKQEDLEKYLEALLDVITELMEKIFSYIQSYLRKEYDIEEENLSPEELIKSFYSADGKTIFDYSSVNVEPKNVEQGLNFVKQNGEIATGEAVIFKFLTGDSKPENSLGENGNFYLKCHIYSYPQDGLIQGGNTFSVSTSKDFNFKQAIDEAISKVR